MRVWTRSALCLGLIAMCGTLGACADARTGWVRNDSDTVMRIRFWSGPRERGDDPSALRPGEVYDVLPGKSARVKLDEECGFESAAASIVRVQTQPMGVSFKRVIHYWFELNPPGPYGVRTFGARPDIRAERDGPGTMLSVPIEHRPQEPQAE